MVTVTFSVECKQTERQMLHKKASCCKHFHLVRCKLKIRSRCLLYVKSSIKLLSSTVNLAGVISHLCRFYPAAPVTGRGRLYNQLCNTLFQSPAYRAHTPNQVQKNWHAMQSLPRYIL